MTSANDTLLPLHPNVCCLHIGMCLVKEKKARRTKKNRRHHLRTIPDVKLRNFVRNSALSSFVLGVRDRLAEKCSSKTCRKRNRVKLVKAPEKQQTLITFHRI